MIVSSRSEFLKGLVAATSFCIGGCLSLSVDREEALPLTQADIGKIKKILVWTNRSGVLEQEWYRLLAPARKLINFGTVKEAECVIAYGTKNDGYPDSSIVVVQCDYVEICWYDGNERPPKEKLAEGCRVIGEKGTKLFAGDEIIRAPQFDEELFNELTDGALAGCLAQKNPGRVLHLSFEESAKNL